MDESIFDALDGYDLLDDAKPSLRRHLVAQLARYDRAPQLGEAIAYEMAGLLALRYIASASKDDPYVVALLLAAELELPPVHRARDASWEKLRGLLALLD